MKSRRHQTRMHVTVAHSNGREHDDHRRFVPAARCQLTHPATRSLAATRTHAREGGGHIARQREKTDWQPRTHRARQTDTRKRINAAHTSRMPQALAFGLRKHLQT